ncbi:hypothetical protein B296_00025099 [Ensete ventricosum]|uniref:Uncharacterized protein n=1 Tax=Ensete ventricosum TaxID=4639 RepID=A0A427AHM7_ENSVE|nr:hypothetical protein B296_00025099 [Ensete ventricosum]
MRRAREKQELELELQLSQRQPNAILFRFAATWWCLSSLSSTPGKGNPVIKRNPSRVATLQHSSAWNRAPMPRSKRLPAAAGGGRRSGGGGSGNGFRPPVVLLLFFFVLAPLLVLAARRSTRTIVSPGELWAPSSLARSLADDFNSRP